MKEAAILVGGHLVGKGLDFVTNQFKTHVIDRALKHRAKNFLFHFVMKFRCCIIQTLS